MLLRVTAALPDGVGAQHHADEAVYAAKRAGGGRIAIWSDDRIVVKGDTKPMELTT